MPAPTHPIVIAPLDKLTAVQLKWGFTLTADVYTLLDAPPRSATHKVRSGSATVSQIALVQSHISSPDPDLEGVRAVLWVRDQPTPYPALLAGDPDNGIPALTTDPGTI